MKLMISALMTALTLCAGFASAQQEPTPAPKIEPHRPRLAILPFKNKTGVPHLGEISSDVLTTILLPTKRFVIVEREQLDVIMAEQDLGASKAVSRETLAKIGQLTGAEWVLMGSATRFEITQSRSGIGLGYKGYGVNLGSGKLRVDMGVDARIVNTTTGEVLYADRAEASRTETAEALGLSVKKIQVGGEAATQIDRSNGGEQMTFVLEKLAEKLLRQIDASK
jgi:curli biogenesis system outer membrane secretion channel CsgG